MSWSKKSLPLNVNHYPEVVSHPQWQYCSAMLSKANPELLNSLFGQPIKPKKYSKYWRIGKLAISGIVEPYIIAFDGAQTGHSIDEILREIDMIYAVLHKELTCQK